MNAASNTAPAPAQVTMVGDRELSIERVFNATRERVWRAFTEPDLLAQWWGRGNRLDIERYEFVKGGHWRFLEHSDHGDHGFEGRFREITPPRRLSLTFEWDGMPGYPVINTMELSDLGDGRTKIVATSQFFTPQERDGMMKSGMETGLNQSYAALDVVLANMK